MQKHSKAARKTRVMHVVLNMGNGGLENVVLNLCRNIAHPQIAQSVCCLEAEGSLVPILKEMGIPVFFMAKKQGVDYLLLFRLALLFRREKIDIVHSHDTGANVYGALGGMLGRVKTLIKTEHGGINLATPSLLKLDTWLSNRLDKIIAVSKYLKECLVKQGVKSQKIFVVPNGIEVTKYHQPVDITQKRKELGFCDEDVILYTVGRFVPLKNIQLLIKVAPQITAEFPRVKIAIIGFGPLEAQLKQMVAELNLQEKVKFLGNRIDLPQLLPVMDIFVLCSRLEGLGLVILEAMAAGKAVIATKVGGIPQIITNDRNGLLFTSDNEAELVNALRKMLSQPQLRNKLAAAGLKTVNEHFNITNMASAHEEAYLAP